MGSKVGTALGVVGGLAAIAATAGALAPAAAATAPAIAGAGKIGLGTGGLALKSGMIGQTVPLSFGVNIGSTAATGAGAGAAAAGAGAGADTAAKTGFWGSKLGSFLANNKGALALGGQGTSMLSQAFPPSETGAPTSPDLDAQIQELLALGQQQPQQVEYNQQYTMNPMDYFMQGRMS